MTHTDHPLGLRTRSREQIVTQLVRLLQRCDEFDHIFEDCLEEAEERFLDLVDAQAETGTPTRCHFAPSAAVVLIASPAKVRRYHSRNTIVAKLGDRGASWDIAGLAQALGRSVRYIHSLLREDPRTRVEPAGHARVSDFRVYLRSWQTQG